jgi:hypothetical protein
MSKKTGETSRAMAAVAGIAGIILAFGITELVHGLYQMVPSVLVSIAQGIVEFTPGSLVTQGIELLGTADIPVLIATVVIGTLAIAAGLAILAVKRPYLALAGVAVLAAIAIAATFAEPFISPAATVITVVGALLAGTAVAEYLLRAVGLRPVELAGRDAAASAGEPGGVFPPVTRSREAGPGQPISVGRGGFLLLGGGATVAGLVAAGVGRALTGGNAEAAAPKKLNLAGTPAKKKGGGGEGQEARMRRGP